MTADAEGKHECSWLEIAFKDGLGMGGDRLLERRSLQLHLPTPDYLID